jgi:hypothetical protein
LWIGRPADKREHPKRVSTTHHSDSEGRDMQNVSIQDLHVLFRYNEKTGALTRRSTQGGVKAGTECRSMSTPGYLKVTIKDSHMYVHRVVYAMYYNRWPTKFIDHINGDRTDNRICNLRNVDKIENSKNSRLSKRNNIGIFGVSIRPGSGKYSVKINNNKKVIYLGEYHDLFSAAAARKSAELKYGYHQNHGRKNAKV